jgi:A/G-specific adenine glycosylase
MSRAAPTAQNDRAAIRRALLAWYRRHARDLPWRRTRDPYRIWLSEVLLQQTRVETALPYFEQFTRRFPTVRHLARAKLDDVLRLWAGLGYYRRARNLHQAARIIANEHDGAFPQTIGELQRLPGIGPYTAGAIASIAFNERAAVVDGNVTRVLARLFAIRAPIDTSATRRRLWTLAEALLAPRAPGQFNQALMELGSRVCLPGQPACLVCPLRTRCAAAARRIQGRLPVRRPKRPVPRVEAVAAAIPSNGCYLIVQRPPTGLLGGLWTLPGDEVSDGRSHAAVLRARLKALLGIDVVVGTRLGTVEHVFSHRVLKLHIYRCEQRGGRPLESKNGRARWLSPRRFHRYAFASVDRKALALLGASGQG